MNFENTVLPGVILIEPDVHRDTRGFFLESYSELRYAEAGIVAHFVQHNHSYSERGTLRGLHAQVRHPQAKLVRVIEGSVYDPYSLSPSARLLGSAGSRSWVHG